MTKQELEKIQTELKAPTIRELTGEEQATLKRKIDRIVVYGENIAACLDRLELDSVDIAKINQVYELISRF